MKRPWRIAFLVAAVAGSARADDPPFYADRANLLVVRGPEGAETPIVSPRQWPERRGHILANMQLVMGPLPSDDRLVPLDPQWGAPVDCGDYQRRELSFRVEGDERLPGYLLVPQGAGRCWPAMLCLHQTVACGKDEPAGLAGSPHLRYAEELARRGYVTLAVDYPNFGSYRCDPYARGYASATMKGIWNHRRAIDLLVSLPEVDAERIGVIGHSLGGHNSLFLAAFDPRVRCTVTCCGFCSFARYRGGDLAGWSHAGYMPRIREVYAARPERMPFEFGDVLAAIAPRAVLVVAPLGDDNFDVAGVRESLAAAAPVYELLGAADRLAAEFPDAAHEFPPESRRGAYRWIDRQMDVPRNRPATRAR